MSTIEIKKRLIDKIQETENEELLQEAYRLLDLEIEDAEIYTLNTDQKKVIDEAMQQIKNGQSISDQQANKEIDEWLSK